MSITLPVKELIRALEFCAPAMSYEETRYYLNGIYFHQPEGGTLVLAATDGYKLQSYNIQGVEGGDLGGFIIPKEVVKLMIRAAKEFGLKHVSERAEITIQEMPRRINFDLAGIGIYCRDIDGKFPDYDRVVPKGEMVPAELVGEGLNSRYVADIANAVANLGEGNRGLEFLKAKDGGPGTPLIMRTRDTVSVIMPMRV